MTRQQLSLHGQRSCLPKQAELVGLEGGFFARSEKEVTEPDKPDSASFQEAGSGEHRLLECDGREVTSGALLRKKSTLTWMYLARCRGWQAQRGEDRTGEGREREGKTRKRQSFKGQAKMTKLIH